MTWCPSATRARAIRPPMNPVAPVTRYFVRIPPSASKGKGDIRESGRVPIVRASRKSTLFKVAFHFRGSDQCAMKFDCTRGFYGRRRRYDVGHTTSPTVAEQLLI